MIYAGIGSRKTPWNVLELMTKIAIKLAKNKWMLRSGHAKGADRAFEEGCDEVGGHKEIYTKADVTQEALDMAAKFHPAWHNCDDVSRALHARNCYIILGMNLKTPVDIVLAYSPGGYKWGGTSQGLRIAKGHGIPVINMFDNDTYLNMKDTYRNV